MKPIKFSINVKANDCYIYSGHLFLVLKDGRIVYTPISKIIRKLINNYPDFENLVRLSFQRNDYLSNTQGEMILGLGELRKIFSDLWKRATSEIQFIIEFQEKDFELISEVPSDPVLDMRLYAMRMYLGCKEGLFEVKLNPHEDKYRLNPSRPEKRFDAKVINLNAKSGEIIISANSEGLFHGSFLNESRNLKVNHRPLAPKSLRTGWSNYDVINYEEQNNFLYFVNETSKIEEKFSYSKFDEKSERRRITEFGKSRYEMSKLLEYADINFDNIGYCFNSSMSGFFFTKDGRFVNINLSKEKKENLHFRSKSHILPNLETSDQKFKRPISSSIVPKGCVVEYFDKVVLYQNGKAKIIETSPSINVRTYSNSIRYKNLISVVKESEISIHSIYPFDELPPNLTFHDFDFENSI